MDIEACHVAWTLVIIWMRAAAHCSALVEGFVQYCEAFRQNKTAQNITERKTVAHLLDQ